MAVIRTVLGDIPSEQAGTTLAHEHIQGGRVTEAEAV